MAYYDKYGVEFYDEGRKILIRCPKNFQDEYAIPNGVTCIGRWAFSGCSGLTSIEIPTSVISIERCAFYGCSGLTCIEIPNSVSSIGDGVFEGCTGLTSITIPNSVTSIWNCAFCGCSSLKSVIIPDSLTRIGERAFDGCYSLKSIYIPRRVQHIDRWAFANCNSLTHIVVEDGNEIFDSRDNCNAIIKSNLNMLIVGCNNSIIPNSITIIGSHAFDSCSGLTSIVIPNSVTSIGSGAFSGCTGLTSITIPNSVTSISDYTFRECFSLKSVKFPYNVAWINKMAFEGCHGLTSITIPESVRDIRNDAFSGCINLKEINVPIGQEERFCQMEGLKNYAEIIQTTSERRIQHEREVIEQQRLQIQQEQEMLQDSILFFDTETTGVPRNYKAPVTNSSNWPRLVQLAWLMADKSGNILKRKSVIIKPDGFSIPSDASAVHGITTERAQREGQPLDAVLAEFMTDVHLASSIVGHNIDFDMHIVGSELYRLDMDYDLLMDKPCTCTMKSSTDFCAIPSSNSYFGGYKWPSLQELYRKLFNRDFTDAHDALADITATKDCYYELKQRRII